MKKLIYIVSCLITFFAVLAGFHSRPDSHEQMVDLLKKLDYKFQDYRNDFSPESQLAHIDSTWGQSGQTEVETYMKANVLLKLGEEEKAINLLNALSRKLSASNATAAQLATGDLALAYVPI